MEFVEVSISSKEEIGTSGINLQGMTKNRDFTEEQAKFAFSCADVNEDDKIDISEFVQLFFPSAKEVGPADTFD